MPDLADLTPRDRAEAAAVGEAIADMRTAAGIGFDPGRVAVEMREVRGQAGEWEVYLTAWDTGAELGTLGQFSMSDIRRRADELVVGQN